MNAGQGIGLRPAWRIDFRFSYNYAAKSGNVTNNLGNSGDTPCLLVTGALVLMMTPALPLFYGGMVRRKNFLSTSTLSFAFMALVGVQ
jgi:hypothetical protein